MAAGVEGILNFAPVTIVLPDTVRQVGVDLAIELEQLSFAIVNGTEVDDEPRMINDERLPSTFGQSLPEPSRSLEFIQHSSFIVSRSAPYPVV